MAKLLKVLIFTFCSAAQVLYASDKVAPCENYLKDGVGVLRVESLLGRQTAIVDASDNLIERRSPTDPGLRVINLGEIFAEGRLFVGFGRPNVYLGIPDVEDKGLGYAKVDAKSLRRADTKVARTLDRVQSGLLLVFKDLPPEAVESILQVARQHEGTRRWTCVNANCAILSDAGFSIGGESLTQYYFPVRLLKDILQYGLEYKGQPVTYDLVKTTPGYLEDIGLSISHAVRTTLCRHGEKTCSAIDKKISKNAFIVKIKQGLKAQLGLALFEDAPTGPIERPQFESQLTPVQVDPQLIQNYDLNVSEPSQLGTLLRLAWGPHSLFEVEVDQGLIQSLLPNKLRAYPDEKPSLATKLKKNFLFNPSVIAFIRSHLSRTYKKVSGLDQNSLFGMLRTDSAEFENKYNFVLTGTKLIIMKISVGSKYADWVLSKHVLMSKYSNDVRMAGELWKDVNGVIHFNMNSGTYKPSRELALPAEKLFNQLFPGVAVQVETESN